FVLTLPLLLAATGLGAYVLRRTHGRRWRLASYGRVSRLSGWVARSPRRFVTMHPSCAESGTPTVISRSSTNHELGGSSSSKGSSTRARCKCFRLSQAIGDQPDACFAVMWRSP